MAYLPLSFVPKNKKSFKNVNYRLPVGGVKLSDNTWSVDEGKCSYMCNMDVLSDRLRNRVSQEAVCESFTEEGKINGYFKSQFYDKLVFHAGTHLYLFGSGDEKTSIIADNLPDKPSLFCIFLSKIYIYCDTHVYTLDSEFNFAEELPDAPLIYESCVANVRYSGKRTELPFNLLAPRITVSYSQCTNRTFILPQNADVTRGAVVYKDGEEMPSDEFELHEDYLEISDGHGAVNRLVSLSYFVSEPEKMEFENVISDCELVADFGGNAEGGTRLFFTGNKNKKGYYYKSDFLNPLYVAGDGFEIIGNGSENITALKKMYGNMIVFTEQSVFRMGYTLDKDGSFFSVKELSSEAGCDCPDSVQLIDNRVVFANSKKGVFIIESTGENGEQNIKPISGNILKGNGMGLCDIPTEALKKAKSIDFDRKYMLFADGKAYIWDYDEAGFSGSSNYSRAEERLKWYVYDGILGSEFVEVDRSLLSFDETDGVRIFWFNEDVKESDCEGVFYSGNSVLFAPKKRKHVYSMSIKLSRSENCDITLGFFGDGEKYYETKLPKCKKNKEKIIMKLPKKALYDFAFSIKACGEYEIQDIAFGYYEIKE